MEKRILQFVYAFGVVNFAVFGLGAVYLGGDAINGYAVDGRYFLASHGHPKEVSHAIFTYSRWQGVSAIIFVPISAFCGWLLRRTDGRN
jgi:hypothetical protein